jgi:hypothetical protein
MIPAVLHLGKNLDLITEITGRPVERLIMYQAAVTDGGADQTEA